MKFEGMFFCIIFGDLDVFSITWVETAIDVLLRWRLGCSQCAKVTQGTGEPTSNISLSFHRCQKHICVISTMSKAYLCHFNHVKSISSAMKSIMFQNLVSRDGGSGLTFSHHSISLWGDLFPEAPPPSVLGRWNSLLYFHGDNCLCVACY